MDVSACPRLDYMRRLAGCLHKRTQLAVLAKQLAPSRNGYLRQKIVVVALSQKSEVVTTDTLAVRRVLLASICLDQAGGV